MYYIISKECLLHYVVSKFYTECLEYGIGAVLKVTAKFQFYELVGIGYLFRFSVCLDQNLQI